MKFTINGMEHTPATAIVFQSDDYSRFNMIKGNRSLDMNKIKRILADIERGTNLLKYCPVLVVEHNGKLDIVDGQHRFAISKKIKSPIYYIIAESLSLYDIARMNSNTEKWKAKDFINCYKELGNQNYIILEKLLEAYPKLPVTTALTLLSEGKVGFGGRGQNAFQRGEFIVKYQDASFEFCNKVDLFSFEGKFSRCFMQAIAKVVESNIYSIEYLAYKVNDHGDLPSQDHWRKYLTAMEEVVSKGKHKRVAIY